MTLRFEVLHGPEITARLDDLADLRITVFRDWPYLYDGDRDYERGYLTAYRDNAGAILVAALDGDQIVGAATGSPMADHASEFAAAFAVTGIDLARVFYCAESVLLPDYRGQGAGHAFFDLREAHVAAMGHDHVAFCAVQRPADHPLRPASYRPLDAFWRKRGYRPLPGVVAEFDWKDIDQPASTSKPLQFWMRQIAP